MTDLLTGLALVLRDRGAGPGAFSATACVGCWSAWPEVPPEVLRVGGLLSAVGVFGVWLLRGLKCSEVPKISGSGRRSQP